MERLLFGLYRGGADDAAAFDRLAEFLDRIDSSGHYEDGNLQVVCQFINFWKGDSENELFARLLMLVRNQDEIST
jgi:hypothetical protein